MAIQWIAGDTFTCVSGDTKPTLVPAETKAIETNTDDVYRFNGTSWVLFAANDKTETLTNKTIGDKVTFAKVSVPSDQSNAEDSVIYNAEIDTNNNGLFVKIQKGGVIYEVPIA